MQTNGSVCSGCGKSGRSPFYIAGETHIRNVAHHNVADGCISLSDISQLRAMGCAAGDAEAQARAWHIAEEEDDLDNGQMFELRQCQMT